MFKSTRVLLTALALCGANTSAHAQYPGQQPPSMVTTDTEAFALLHSDLVAMPQIRQMAISNDGRYVVLARSSERITPKLINDFLAGKVAGPPPGEVSLVLWDNKTRASKEIWKADSNTTFIEALHWLPDSEVGLALVRENVPATPQNPNGGSRQGLLRISSLGTRPQVIGLTELGNTRDLELHVSPVTPLAMVVQSQFEWHEEKTPDGKKMMVRDGHRTVYLLGDDGRLGASIQLPKDLELGQVIWSEAGSPVLAVSQVVDKKLVQKYFAIDRRNAGLKPLDKAPDLYEQKQPTALPVRLKTTQLTAREGQTTQAISALWLEGAPKSESPRVLVAADSTGGRVLPKAEGILYFSQGALWAAPLARVPKELFLAARQAAERTRIISNAKQLGLATLMYSQDYDETLPTPDGINGKLEPYLKNASLFEGFAYTFGGGPLSGVDNPVETELGYVTGPGGRAIIYIDGHVKWRPDSP
jgi:hypothetical protein